MKLKGFILGILHGMVLLFENLSMLVAIHSEGSVHTSSREQKIRCCTFEAKSEKKKVNPQIHLKKELKEKDEEI